MLTSSKAGIETAVTGSIDPTKRAAAEQAEQTARATADYSAREAWTVAKKAEIDLASAKDDNERAKNQLTLDLAKRKANRAYADLGWTIPFPEVWP